MADLFFRCPRCDGHLVVDDRGAGLELPCPFCSATVQIPTESQTSSPEKGSRNRVQGESKAMASSPTSAGSSNRGATEHHERRRLASMMSPDDDTAPSERGTRSGLPSGRNQALRTADDLRKASSEGDSSSDLDSQFQELIRKEIVRLQAGETGTASAEAVEPQTPLKEARRKPLPPLAQHAEVVPSEQAGGASVSTSSDTQPERIKRQRPESVGASLPPLVTLDSMELDSEVAKHWGDQAVVKTGNLNWVALVFILAALGLGGYFGYHGYQQWSTNQDGPVEEPKVTPINQKEVPPSAAPEAQPVLAALQKFHEAISPEAKSVSVRNRESVLPLMQEYYALTNVESRLIDKTSLRFDKRLIGKTYFHTVSGEYSETLRPFYADFEERPNSNYLLDWESWVGHSNMTLESFAEQGLTHAKVFRVWVEVQDYYRYDYADAATYRSYLIKDKSGKVPLYGYAEVGTPDGEMMIRLFRELKKQGEKQRARLMLALQFAPDADKRRGQVIISRLVNDSWIEQPGQ